MNREKLLERLAPPEAGRTLDVVIDTDTYNEVDDQFAIAYALLSAPRVDIQAIYAAPFFNERSTSPGHGMRLSYQEIKNILVMMDISPDGFAFMGSERTFTDAGAAVESPAARDLIDRAMRRDPDGDPLYVVALGAISNVVSAIMLEPAIKERIAVVWMGMNARYWKTPKEFNCCGDLKGTQYLLDCGVPLVIMPAMAASSHMLTTIYDLEHFLGGRSALCDLLLERFRGYSDDHYGWSKEIWDAAAVAYLVNPDWIETELMPSPVVLDDCAWGPVDLGRHPVRMCNFLDRNRIFADLYRKLSAFGA